MKEPIVYSMLNNQEKFSFIQDKYSQGELDFIETRKHDERLREVYSVEELCQGRVLKL